MGVIIAAGIGGLHTFEEEAGYYAIHGEQNGPQYNPFFIPKMIADIASGHVSMEYGYHGPNYGVVSACASSNNAIIDAFNLIRLGKADAIVTGGAEAAIFPAGVGGFNSMHALSTRNDSPETASRPFSASRDGFVIGEGSVVLILEEMEHALARGAKIYGEIAGGGMSADAYHITATHPEGLGAILSMQNALDDAGMTPADIDYINVHGTSTGVGDISEAKAIIKLFGEDAYRLNISSTKSMTGHLWVLPALWRLCSRCCLYVMISCLRQSTTPKATTIPKLIIISISPSIRHKNAKCVLPCPTPSASVAIMPP